MIYRNALLFTCWTLVYGQPLPAPPGIDVGALTDQARQFADLYGIAAQLMNFGGTIINNAKSVYDSTGYDDSSLSRNSVSGDLLRPWLRGDRTNLMVGKTQRSALPLSEHTYGNDYSSMHAIRTSAIETLLNTFLGPSFLGQTTLPPPTNLANFFKPQYHQSENYHASGGSNIDRLINLLRRSGAQRASPNLESSPNLLQAIFGKKR
ncbi:unnamed protein product [Litomosoides sigmodontis]|uniref:Uncharacterized protein n=1 Tax=Litomosoides sigmodontis TaxID=42156 RepID=A0A3P6STD4_LITSI|nr:unnamed protein product [Litomosoides sigmodontis]